MKEKTVFFDLDDTLYDRSGPYLAAFRQFFGGRYEDKAAQAYQAVMHRGYEVFTAAHTGKISMDAMHIYRHQIGLLDVGIRITAAQALQLQAVYAAQQQRITLSAAVRAALDYCREAYRAIGVITNGNAYYNAVSQRETFGGTTAIGSGIALPHASNAGVSAPGISALLLRRGVDWGAPDGQPVDLVFMIAVPPKSESLHLQILARLVNLLGRRDLVEALRTASNPQRFVELIAKTENACFAD